MGRVFLGHQKDPRWKAQKKRKVFIKNESSAIKNNFKEKRTNGSKVGKNNL